VRELRKQWGPAAVILAFAALSTALGIYTLGQQRVSSPFTSHYEVRIAFARTPGLAPGLGQPATVAGVHVGEVTGVDLVEGRAVVTLTIDRDQLPRVYADASAALRPNTALGDQEITLRPGRPPATVLGPRDTIDVGATQVPTGPDGLLGALDADTRQYFTALLSAAGAGLHGRGPDLRALLQAIGPTARQTRELSDAVVARRRSAAKVVHSLSVLAVAAGSKDRDIVRAVRGGSATLQAIAAQDAALRRSLQLLPSTLRSARGALAAVTPLGRTLRPALTALRPTTQHLDRTLTAIDALSATATPALRRTIRPLVRAAVPALTQLNVAAPHLNAVTPDLQQAFRVLEYAGNELFYSDGGRARGYPFWLAWAQHNGNSVLSTGDAHGQVVRSALIFSCSGFDAVPQLQTLFAGVDRLLPAACPTAKDGQ
jgi:phospholipid/cholesterol/gamma-HCH transport system substrate-binding protein